MAYNKQYNTRFSGRYNTPGQFVSAGELVSGAVPAGLLQRPRHYPPYTKYYSSSYGQAPRKQMPQNIQPIPKAKIEDEMAVDNDMALAIPKNDGPGGMRPHWMKSKLPGVKKVSNKERRRRQNENLRRLLTPKNALMVLNEMMPNEQVANQFKVEPSANNQYYKATNTHSFCADLTIDGNCYKGYGENKLMARNAAAEQAIRDLIIKKMNKAVNSDSGKYDVKREPTASSAGGASVESAIDGMLCAAPGSTNGDGGCDEEALPMIQLASFALHKLFTEWEYEGHKVPALKPLALAAAEPAPPAPGKPLPPRAAAMHPCMLLTYMRPHLEYRELAVDGDRPQNMLFTMGVDVDGTTYVGKAPNKKEARKLAAKAACRALFNVEFDAPPPPPDAAQAAPATATQ
ncbi:unnamed protein product [Chrysodeixis includens]|uniref:DRBM domain-containing protein n=1 Tax=Chrysodeixis includens TaxID=689277 RepID=A0A9P0FT45_CHRIL|nr:unnamed protein product [Chrysodeixis includens]